MIIDVNGHLGAYAFRHLRITRAADLAAQMDRHGMSLAVVSSIAAALYRDPLAGDQAMMEDITQAGLSERFFPLATINPTYADWRGDLDRATQRLGLRGVRLLPAYHGYQLGDRHGQALLAEAARRGLPVAIPQRLEDRRQQHAWDQAQDLRLPDVVAALKPHKGLAVILQNWAGLSPALLADLQASCPLLVDISRLEELLHGGISTLAASIGWQAIALGTHQPLNQPMHALVKLAVLPEAVRRQVAHENAARWLGIAQPAMS